MIRSCKVLGEALPLLTFDEVCSNIDDLFQLPAPAAMGRGPWSGYTHGERMNGAVLRSQVILETDRCSV